MAEADKIEYRERPILFSAPMVRALLDDTKTQTRRIVKWQEEWHPDTHRVQIIECGDCIAAMPLDCYGRMLGEAIKCPYGQPGDRLWVREAWQTHGDKDGITPRDLLTDSHIQYPATYDFWVSKKRSSIHMPRWASRITLEITGVRVERLQDISEADAIAEGVERMEGEDGFKVYAKPWGKVLKALNAGTSYRSLWESLNGPGSWDLNPFVWRISFKRLEAA